MKNKLRPTLFFSFVLLIFASCSNVKWNSSFSEAKKIATKKDKDIFMVISGGAESSDEFKSTVLDSKDFLSAVGKKFELLFINLSADGLKDLSQEELSKVYDENSKIIMDYSVTDELTMLMLNQDGYWLKSFPYADKYKDPALLIADLFADDEKVSMAHEYISAIKKFDGSDRAKAINNLYEFTDENYKLPLIPLCYEIPDLDSENNTGLLGKYELIIAYDRADKILSAENVDQAAQVFVDAAEHGHLDRSQKFEAYFTAAYLYPLVGSTNFDKMCELLEQAYDSNPSDPHVNEVTDLLQNIRDMKLVYENSQNQQPQETGQ